MLSANNAETVGSMLRFCRIRVQRINPVDFFRRLDRLDIQVNDDGILTAAHEHATECRGFACVDLLMGHKGRNDNKITGRGLGDKLQVFAPAHARSALTT